MNSWPPGGDDAVLKALQRKYFPTMHEVDMPGLLRDEALGRVAVVSSFGAESVVMLHYLSSILPEAPVLFLDTGKHFDETLDYRDEMTARFGFKLHVVRPEAETLADEDPTSELHRHDPDGCCRIRKTLPLQDALDGYDSWVSGRKRFHGASRAALPLIERDGEKIKINPLATWSREQIRAYFERHDLPAHPLEARGYPSIGCAPCTRPVAPGEHARAGRWSAVPDKTECGIHLSPDGRFVRSSQGEG